MASTVQTNGLGEPRCPVAHVEPGSIVRLGIDDEVTGLVIANFASHIHTGTGDVSSRHVVFYGLSDGSWSTDQLFEHDYRLTETLTVILKP